MLNGEKEEFETRQSRITFSAVVKWIALLVLAPVGIQPVYISTAGQRGSIKVLLPLGPLGWTLFFPCDWEKYALRSNEVDTRCWTIVFLFMMPVWIQYHAHHDVCEAVHRQSALLQMLCTIGAVCNAYFVLLLAFCGVQPLYTACLGSHTTIKVYFPMGPIGWTLVFPADWKKLSQRSDAEEEHTPIITVFVVLPVWVQCATLQDDTQFLLTESPGVPCNYYGSMAKPQSEKSIAQPSLVVDEGFVAGTTLSELSDIGWTVKHPVNPQLREPPVVVCIAGGTNASAEFDNLLPLRAADDSPSSQAPLIEWGSIKQENTSTPLLGVVKCVAQAPPLESGKRRSKDN